MRRWASRVATRRISWTDQQIRLSPDGLALLFLGVRLGWRDGALRPSGQGQHHKRDVPVPSVPGAGLVVSKPELRLGSLERVLDSPTPSLDGDERADRRAGRAPGREEGEFAVGQAAADQKPARPQPRVALVVIG